MENLINEKPTTNLHGRTKVSVEFVQDTEIKDKKILDISCGYGWCELNFLNRGAAKIYASEISEKDLTTIKQNLDDPRLEFLVADATQLPLPDNSVDTVVCWEVIEHIPKNTENKMFSEVARVLKPNGVFYLSTPYKSFLATVLDPAWWLMGHRHYSKKQLSEFGKQNGFEVVDMFVKGRYWELFSILDMYISKWVFRRKMPYQKKVIENLKKEYEKDGFVDIFVKFKKIS